MAASKVNKENYIALQGWMISDLKLKGNELIIYACIYGFSQAENQVFNGGLQYLADWTNSTKQGVIKCLKSLIAKGFIEKKETMLNGIKFCEYRATKLNELLNKVECLDKQSLIDGDKQSLTNNKEPDNLTEKIKEIINYLNGKLGTKYSYKSKTTQTHIKSRFNEIDGLTVADFFTVIDKKYEEWKGTDMEKFLRPETLFGNKFEGYLNGKVNKSVPASKPRYGNFDPNEAFKAALRRTEAEMHKSENTKTVAEDEALRERAEALRRKIAQEG